MSFPLVDNPSCIYTRYPNGTWTYEYVGPATSQPVSLICTKINLRSANISMVACQVLANIICTYLSYRLLLSRKRTVHNWLMLFIPMITTGGLVINLIDSWTYFQWFGTPHIALFSKFFYFLASVLITLAESVRFNLLILLLNGSEKWTIVFPTFNILLGLVCGILSIISIVGGSRTPIPYTFYLAYVALLELAISVVLLNLCYNQTAQLLASRSFSVNTDHLRTLARNYKLACGGHLLLIVLTFVAFYLGTQLGLTVMVLSSCVVPSTCGVLIYAIWTLQKVMEKGTKVAGTFGFTNKNVLMVQVPPVESVSVRDVPGSNMETMCSVSP